jgi:Mor family transcriptional regulator
MKAKSIGGEVIADLADKAAAIVAQHPALNAEAAALMGCAIADLMRKEWGGQIIYFSKGVQIDISQRDFEMHEKFDGCNQNQLAREYNLSVTQVYRRLKSVAAALKASRQPGLF